MYKQKGNPFEVTSCGRRRNYMTSPLKKAGKIKTKRAPELNQKTKDSLQGEAFKYGKAFYSPKHKVNVDPEDGVLSNRVFYEDGSELKYESIDKPFDSPANKAEPRRTIGKGKNFNKANPTGTGADAGGGMTQKGVNEYKSKNPGSNLKTAVTKKPSQLKPGSKDAKRRKSFCARSKSWKSERGRAARRRWNC
jgi:hypothetical protein|tara:strand:- start:18 stop:596 length:579 start_codon:yes stop_codon:yes gene_type:complete